MSVKLLGLCLVFSVCAAAGFLKSSALRQRCERLKLFLKSLSALSGYIAAGAGEIESILPKCFEKERVFINENNAIEFDPSFLKKEDAALIREYFENFGLKDSRSEYERTKLYMDLIAENCKEAEKECEKLCRLYNTLGIFCGLFICIFFL